MIIEPELEKRSHPSFGCVEIARWQSGHDHYFFDSKTQAHSGIHLTIFEAQEVTNPSNHEKYASLGKPIIEVDFTEIQFAHLITSLNAGQTSCTIRFRDGKPIERLKNENLIEDAQYRFKQRLGKILEFSKLLTVECSKYMELPKLNAQQRKDLKEMIDALHSEMTKTMPYVFDIFTEAVEDSVLEAQGRINSIISQLDSAKQVYQMLESEKKS